MAAANEARGHRAKEGPGRGRYSRWRARGYAPQLVPPEHSRAWGYRNHPVNGDVKAGAAPTLGASMFSVVLALALAFDQQVTVRVGAKSDTTERSRAALDT